MKHGMLVYHHDLECPAKGGVPIFKVKVIVLAEIIKNKFLPYLNFWNFCNQHGIVVHHREPQWFFVAIFYCCPQGQGHIEDWNLQEFLPNKSQNEGYLATLGHKPCCDHCHAGSIILWKNMFIRTFVQMLWKILNFAWLELVLHVYLET